jgi:hypothetical protein
LWRTCGGSRVRVRARGAGGTPTMTFRGPRIGAAANLSHNSATRINHVRRHVILVDCSTFHPYRRHWPPAGAAIVAIFAFEHFDLSRLPFFGNPPRRQLCEASIGASSPTRRTQGPDLRCKWSRLAPQVRWAPARRRSVPIRRLPHLKLTFSRRVLLYPRSAPTRRGRCRIPGLSPTTSTWACAACASTRSASSPWAAGPPTACASRASPRPSATL